MGLTSNTTNIYSIYTILVAITESLPFVKHSARCTNTPWDSPISCNRQVLCNLQRGDRRCLFINRTFRFSKVTTPTDPCDACLCGAHRGSKKSFPGMRGVGQHLLQKRWLSSKINKCQAWKRVVVKNYDRASRTKWVCSGQIGLYKHPRSRLYLVNSLGKPKSVLSLVLQRGRQW